MNGPIINPFFSYESEYFGNEDPCYRRSVCIENNVSMQHRQKHTNDISTMHLWGYFELVHMDIWAVDFRSSEGCSPKRC